MNFVCYNMADFLGKHFPERWLIIWQGSNTHLRTRFAKFFRELETKKHEHEVYNGHVLVTSGKGKNATCIVYALDCQGGICDPNERQNPGQTYYGEDAVVAVKTFDRARHPGIDSSDTTKHPAYQFVDAAHDKAVPYWEAIKTIPLIPVSGGMTDAEFKQLGQLQIGHGCTQREMIHKLLVVGLKGLSAPVHKAGPEFTDSVKKYAHTPKKKDRIK